MKHQQVVVDYWSMVKSSATCLLLALSGYVLLKMIQTIFWLPGHLKKNQQRLEDLAKQYNIDLSKPFEDENGLPTISDTDEIDDDKDKEKKLEGGDKDNEKCNAEEIKGAIMHQSETKIEETQINPEEKKEK